MSSLAPRTRAFALAQKYFASPVAEAADFAEHRREREKLVDSRLGRLAFGTPDRRVAIEEIDIALDGRTLRALVHRPTGVGGARPVVVNFHGGGWVLGAPEQASWLSSRVAAVSGATVITPSYRLAPEHPFPAAIEDAWDSLAWIAAHHERLGIDPGRLAVMGDSAGGNMAAVTALMARDALEVGRRRRDVPRIGLQVLLYPSVEMYEKFDSELRMPDEPVLSSESMDTFAHLYLGEAYGTEDWRVSPLRAESHADLPPALIVTAERDPLLDNGTAYRDALRDAGVTVDYREYAGAVHGFLSIPGIVPVAHRAAQEIAEVIARHIVTGQPPAHR